LAYIACRNSHSGERELRLALNLVVYMNTLISSPSPLGSPSQVETEPGVLAAAEWVAAGLVGPSPQAVNLIAAVNDGLVRLSDPWEVTRRGRILIERHGRRQ
jgi:hypothetical protein